ncbi:hypothetical protein HDU85_004662 [Gaertneriomyces sp. JEL0708]|nr:hypothetical protein HDU85_004662 [Gaertneriomyces sp. JEL0708]
MPGQEQQTASCGLEILDIADASILGNVGSAASYDYGVIQLLQKGVKERALHTSDAMPDAFSPADLQVTQADWSSYVVGEICACEELDDPHVSSSVKKRLETLVKQQVYWAAHLGLQAIVFSYPATAPTAINFARVVSDALSMLSYSQAWLKISATEDGWKNWNMVRSLCEYNNKLFVALQLEKTLPDDERLLSQWRSEPVKTVILPTSTFLKNAKGYPVLSKRHQAFLRTMMQDSIRFLVTAPSSNEDLGFYYQYLQHLYRSRPEPDVIDQFATGYHDYLQAPLQPLMDNLESATYEVFEKDPIKYHEYERAVYRALCDMPTDRTDPIVITVVGAGRGPLVQRSLQAAEAANRAVKLYAVEKNPNAIVTLQLRKANEWGDRVQVIHTDMRYWNCPEQADILVSELLGSFGDNELSPECLDGAQKVLKPTGISIPSSYTTYIAPLSSTKLFDQVSSYNDQTHFETPYVVKFRNATELASAQSLWTFEHPIAVTDTNNPASPQFNHHNSRAASRTFTISYDAVLHGIAGYFEAVLYKDVMISINPATHSPGMFSWFPIFFPIKVPMYLAKGSEVEICFWRCGDARKVWYEWCAMPLVGGQRAVGGQSAIHNIGGRSSWIGL